MHKVTFQQHVSSRYGPRTLHNANAADLTVAFAMNFYTHGERLTHKAAGDRYIPVMLTGKCEHAAGIILAHCYDYKVSCINIAGNSLYSLKVHGFNQGDVNMYTYKVLRQVHSHHRIARIVSGGQTGADFAGGIAAAALKIPCEMTFPRGFLQRDVYGKDFTNTRGQLGKTFETQLKELKERITIWLR
jgi:hypothetical protein